MLAPSSPSIGIIVSSTRKPRVGPQIADFVLSTLQSSSNGSTASAVNFKLIDLATWNLPIFDEPGIPSYITSSDEYIHEHTRAWSLEIQSYSAFIFVTPQYNWGYPASLKNAIDYLFREWNGKPAMIVSYGGGGGVKAAAQLKQVLQGVRMQVAETMPALKFPDKKAMGMAEKGEKLQLTGKDAIWREDRDEVRQAFRELMELLQPVKEANGFKEI